MKKLLISGSVALMFSASVMAEENLRTMGDMPDAALKELNTLFTDYNKCMMDSRLSTSKSGRDAQQHADEILQSCEQHLESVIALMGEHNVAPGLAEGMTKNMRSRAARKLMARTMNNLAAQAAAMENAQSAQ